MLNFIKREKSFVIAAVSMILLAFISQSPVIADSATLKILMFLFVISVIVYASMGVVHHAELLAYKFGEPYGTMILTFSAVTVEVIMITTMMLHDSDDPLLARDTIFSTVMILLNGLTGLTMLLGGLKYGEQKYNLKSSNSFFSMIFGIIGVGLFLPLVIKLEYYHTFEMFLLITSIGLYIIFLRMQSKEHNYYFKFETMLIKEKGLTGNLGNIPKKEIGAFYHTLFLLLTIGAISVLAETLSLTLDDATDLLNWPAGIAGLIIAIIIVAPEGITAIRASLKNDMQRSINISLGSILSTISVTIPVVIIVGFLTHKEVILGLNPVQEAMIVISLLVGVISYKDGETNALQGVIHFVLFITFVFLIFI
jgi:Ca2+:H+ antiporter